MLRASPFFAGTVMISPRASNATRAPVGEIAAFPSLDATGTKRGSVAVSSPAIVIGTLAAWPVRVS